LPDDVVATMRFKIGQNAVLAQGYGTESWLFSIQDGNG
jgi:hypothetical protein